MALALAPWLIRLAVTRRLSRPLFDLSLALFLLTAGASMWAAYDPDGSRAVFPIPIGWRKLWGLILAAMLFYALASFQTETQRRWIVQLLAGFGAAVSAWFIATHDWSAQPAKSGFITQLGMAVQAPLPYLPGHRLSPNVAGGLTALLMPMSLELMARRGEERRWWAVCGLAATLVMALGLPLTSSRGAWLGVGGALCLAAAWWLAGRLSRGERRLTVFTAVVVLGGLLGGLAIASIPFLRSATLGSYAFANRLRIFSQTALLIRDYPFTGCGLGNFPLVHSTYVLLIHVPVMVYAHSAPLDVAVEQGILGTLAMVIVWVGAGWLGLRTLARSERAPAGLAAGLLALAVLMIHGVFDSVLYSSRALLLLWMPAGLIIASPREQRSKGAEGQGSGEGERGRQRDKETKRKGDTKSSPGCSGPGTEGTMQCPGIEGKAKGQGGKGWGLLAVGVGVLIVGALVWRPVAAAWYANLGAVHQTLDELRSYDYHHFDDPGLDQIRRQEDLSAAVAHFERALALDPGQVTARTRLAQIALARGEYEVALEHAEAAWEAGHRDRVTRLVLGDALVAQGRVEKAVEIVRGLERAETRLDGEAFYRYWLGEDWQRAAYAWRAVLRLDPENARVRQAVKRAEEKANEQ